MPGGKWLQLRSGAGLLWVLCWLLSSCPGTSGTPWIRSVYLFIPEQRTIWPPSIITILAYYSIILLFLEILGTGENCSHKVLVPEICELQAISFGFGTADWFTMCHDNFHCTQAALSWASVTYKLNPWAEVPKHEVPLFKITQRMMSQYFVKENLYDKFWCCGFMIALNMWHCRIFSTWKANPNT